MSKNKQTKCKTSPTVTKEHNALEWAEAGMANAYISGGTLIARELRQLFSIRQRLNEVIDIWQRAAERHNANPIHFLTIDLETGEESPNKDYRKNVMKAQVSDPTKLKFEDHETVFEGSFVNHYENLCLEHRATQRRENRNARDCERRGQSNPGLTPEVVASVSQAINPQTA